MCVDHNGEVFEIQRPIASLSTTAWVQYTVDSAVNPNIGVKSQTITQMRSLFEIEK